MNCQRDSIPFVQSFFVVPLRLCHYNYVISTLFTLILYLLRLPLTLFTLTPAPSQSPHQLCGFSLHTHILSVATMSHLNTWLPLLLALLVLLVFVLLVFVLLALLILLVFVLLALLVLVLLVLLVLVPLLLLGHMPSPTLHLRHVVLLTKWGNPPPLCLLPYNW